MIETYSQIVYNLKKGKFSQIYLLMGEETFFINKISNFLEKNYISEDQKGFNQEIHYGKDSSLELTVIVSAVYVCPVDFTINFSPFFKEPLKILIKEMTPKKLSYQESIINACKFASLLFLGAGIFFAICLIDRFSKPAL